MIGGDLRRYLPAYSQGEHSRVCRMEVRSVGNFKRGQGRLLSALKDNHSLAMWLRGGVDVTFFCQKFMYKPNALTL